MLKNFLWAALFIVFAQPLAAQVPAQSTQQALFTIADIQVQGLQRIPAGSVFAVLPFNINDQATPANVQLAITRLFETGNFNDVAIGREDDILIIKVQERPSIGEIHIDGNKAIKTEDLLKGLSQAGLSEGQVFKRATLEKIRLELERQYVSQGRYDAEIVAEVEPVARNRVALNIDVYEGSVAKIKHLNIVGGQQYSQEQLLELFEMNTTGFWSWAKGDDKYSRERLRADIENLESFYRDQGFLKFAVTSTEVSLSPERDAVYITVNISEGDIYHVSEVKLSGDIILSEATLRQLILLRPKSIYSQSRITSSKEIITRVLGAEGYAFAKVRHYPTVNEEDKTVELTFFVDPGKRTYVNRILFKGNTSTEDEVLRREMRLMEAGPASGPKIDHSKVRLERLGFFKGVESEMKPVPGHDDLVDVEFTVEEQPSGSIGASIGYSDAGGMVFSANLDQKNFLGTGKQVGVGLTRNDYQSRYSFNYTNPYYTVDGVSRGFSLFYSKTDFDRLGVAEYSSNSYGGKLNYGYPISETARIGFGVGYAKIEIETGRYAPQEVIASPLDLGLTDYVERDLNNPVYPDNSGTVDSLIANGVDPFATTTPGFIDEHGDEYNNFTLTAFWSESKLNRGFMPTKGWSQSVDVELGVPSTDLEYFKLNYRGQYFIPLRPETSIRLHTRLGYGAGYGDTEELPFFENYYAGGFGSVRGFERSSLGPKGTPAKTYLADFKRDANGDIDPNGTYGYLYDPNTNKFYDTNLSNNIDPIGGDMLVEGGVELIFPMWFIKERRSLRTVFFVDAGNVFGTECNPGQRDCGKFAFRDLRASYGFGLTWVSALGPLTFSLSQPIQEKAGDDTKFFQFSIGTGF